MIYQNINGDCLDVMASMPDNSFTACITDPPYGLSMMGRGWDYAVPGPDYWKQAYRLLPPGGMVFAFGGTRTYHHLTLALEQSGFEIRDCFNWVHYQGLPKGRNIGKAMVSEFGDHEAAAKWAGYNSALCPAWEPIIVAMKPHEGSFAENALKWGVSGFNVGNARGPGGRHPKNLLHDGSDEVAEQLQHADRLVYCKKASGEERDLGLESLPLVRAGGMSARNDGSLDGHITYRRNDHPTVKPIGLMRYFVRLATMPFTTRILDPFAGSGSTGCACAIEGIDYVGIDTVEKYTMYSDMRMEYWKGRL
jgi:hypothetical protein